MAWSNGEIGAWSSTVAVSTSPSRPQGTRPIAAAERPKAIFACVGRNPSLQRNSGVKLCKTPPGLFPRRRQLREPRTRATSCPSSEQERTAVVGGPNLVPRTASSFEKDVNAVLASWMGSFSVRARYASNRGRPRSHREGTHPLQHDGAT